jgi:DNA-binding MarR family transcriptional regulator
VNSLRTFGFFLTANPLYGQRFAQRVGVFGLTLPQCKVLVLVANQEGISQVRLAELAGLEPMSLVRTLDRLESRGRLLRRRNPADRRARRIYLTAEGKPLVDDIWRLVDLTLCEAFAGIPRKHADLMIELFEKIQSNLASLRPLAKPGVAALQTGRPQRGAPARRTALEP